MFSSCEVKHSFGIEGCFQLYVLDTNCETFETCLPETLVVERTIVPSHWKEL